MPPPSACWASVAASSWRPADEAFPARLRGGRTAASCRATRDPARQALATGVAVFDVEMMVDTPAGTHWLSVSAVPIAAAHGALAGGQRAAARVTRARRRAASCWPASTSAPPGAARPSCASSRGRSSSRRPRCSSPTSTASSNTSIPLPARPTATAGRSCSALNPRLLSAGLTASATYQALWSTILAGRAWRGELANRRRDGSLLYESILISPVRDRSGRHLSFRVDPGGHLGARRGRAPAGRTERPVSAGSRGWRCWG
jgi:hypothetical protein